MSALRPIRRALWVRHEAHRAQPCVSARLVSTGIWSILLRLLGALAAFASGVVLARQLGPSALGVYGVVASIAAILATVAQLGIPPIATREAAVSLESHDAQRLASSVKWFHLATAAAGVLLGAIFVVVALLSGRLGANWLIALGGAFLILPSALVSLTSATLRGFGRLMLGQMLDVAARPALFTIGLLALIWATGALSPASAMAMNVAATAACAGVGVIWLLGSLRGIPNARPGPPQTRQWVAAATPLLGTTLLMQVDAQYGVLLVSALSTAAMTGIVRIAYSAVGFVSLPNTVAAVVLSPTIARLHAADDLSALQAILRRACLLLLVAQFAIFAAALLVGQWFIVAVFGAAYADAWLPLVLLCFAQVVASAFGVSLAVLSMCGGERILFRAYSLSVGASVLAAIPLTMLWQGAGVASAAVVGAIVNGLLCRAGCKSLVDVDPSIFGYRSSRSSLSSRRT